MIVPNEPRRHVAQNSVCGFFSQNGIILDIKSLLLHSQGEFSHNHHVF